MSLTIASLALVFISLKPFQNNDKRVQKTKVNPKIIISKPSGKDITGLPQPTTIEEENQGDSVPAHATSFSEPHSTIGRLEGMTDWPAIHLNSKPTKQDRDETFELKNIKYRQHDNLFVVTIITNAPISNIDSFPLKSPKRLVVDFPGVWKISVKEVLPLQNRWFQRLRIGLHDRYLRLVFDLKEVEFPLYNIFTLPKGIKIEFTTVSSEN